MANEVHSMLRRRTGSQAGYSYIEIMVTAAVLMVLASVAVPMFKWDQKRRKEVRLRVYLQQMRDAIDLYKKYTDEGRILLEDIDQMAAHVQHAAFEDGEQADRTGSDDHDIGRMSRIGHGNSRADRVPVPFIILE